MMVACAGSSLAMGQTPAAGGAPVTASGQPATATPANAEPGAAGLTLRRIGSVTQPGAEIPAYDAPGKRAYVAGGPFVAEIDLRRPGYPGWVRHFDLSEAAGFGTAEGDFKNAANVTHVAVDPAGRNIAAATVRPVDYAGRPGKVVFFHMPTGVILKSLTVGFGPDAAAFTADGSKLVVLNEGEWALGADKELVDPLGGVSVIDLSGIGDAETLVRQLSADRVKTIDLEGAVVERALAQDAPEADRPNGTGPRINPKHKDHPALDLEPESMAIRGDTVYVTLQENNAIATFDLGAMEWKRLVGLGRIEQTIDPSDRDGGIEIKHRVLGMPMPDQIATFEVDGRVYLVTANEGDERGDFNDNKKPLGDAARVRDLAKWNKMAPSLMSTADLSDPVLGRLRVSVFDGDDDGDGLIEKPVMFGTRSLSVWDAQTLKRVGDTGSAFEQMMAEKAKDLFNAERVGTEEPPTFQFDNRSADRGPEPEGVAIGRVGSRVYAFVTLERPGAVVAVDVTDPTAPRAVELVACARDGDVGPEGIAFVPGEQSPSSEPMLVVCNENSGVVTTYRVIAK